MIMKFIEVSITIEGITQNILVNVSQIVLVIKTEDKTFLKIKDSNTLDLINEDYDLIKSQLMQ